MFSDELSYLVLNPSWTVPPTILRKDVAPKVISKPAYLEEMGFDLLVPGTAQRVAASTVDWSKVTPGRFPYTVRQRPGPKNAFGRMKFMFPNSFDVYMHDTPSRELFGKTRRAFSSGCVRIEKPLEMALALLEGRPEWSRDAALDAALRSGEERTVRLTERVPIHLQYWTVWVDESDRIEFREDIYGRDGALVDALRETAPVRP